MLFSQSRQAAEVVARASRPCRFLSPIANRARRFKLKLEMRIVLQNCQSGLYFAGCHRWVNDLNKALDFKRTAKAIDFVKNGKQPDEVQVVMCLDDTNYDFWLGEGELG